VDLERFVTDEAKLAGVYSMDHFTTAWRREDLNRAMANECPYPPSRKVQEAVCEAVKLANLYPEDPTGALGLRTKIADYCGLRPENVTLGNGSMEMLDLVFRVFLSHGDEVITPLPDYPVFRVRPPLYGATVVYAHTYPDLRISAYSIVQAITERTKLIILSRPHNPTGLVLPREDVEMIINQGLPVLVDEAYVELADRGTSVVNLVVHKPNLMVTRTFSKGFGLAGLRIGYLLASAEIIGYANRVKPAENVNLLAQVAASTALDDPEASLSNAAKVRSTRQWLTKELAKLPGLEPVPSQTNFVLVNCLRSGRTSGDIVEELFVRNICVRDFSKAEGLPSDQYFRITVGTPAKMKEIVEALREILCAPAASGTS